jgi:hypothetical protein
MRLGYNTWSMPTLPFDEAVPSFARLGYDRELTASGYDGGVAVEISVFRQRAPGYDPYDAAARSYAVLAKAFDEAKKGKARGGVS